MGAILDLTMYHVTKFSNQNLMHLIVFSCIDNLGLDTKYERFGQFKAILGPEVDSF